jgi:ubiquinone/menaquinone biosynthesis C-methylase UbiE
MGLYETHVAPRLIDRFLGAEPFVPLRRRTAAGLSGDVLELGFGTGRNAALYPPEVRRLLAVDPQPTARRMATERVRRAPLEVVYVEPEDGELLPLDDASVDHALSSFTLCSIADAPRALAEVRRVLRPGGQLHFLEHGRSPEARVARWQDRLTPLQRRLLGGCHINRPIGRMVAEAGFTITEMRHYYLAGPRPFAYMFEGAARA